jgi:RNase H
MIRDDTQARDPCLAAATLGSGARNVGVRLSPLAPPPTCGSSFRCRTLDGGRSSRLAHACSQNEPQQRMRPCSSGRWLDGRLPSAEEAGVEQLEEKALNIYTDGSCYASPRVGGVGYLFVSVDEQGQPRIHEECPPGWRSATNNQMELGTRHATFAGCFSVPWTGNDLATHLAVSRERNRTGRDRSAPPTRHDSTSRDDPVRRGMRDTALARWRHGFDPLGLRR